MKRAESQPDSDESSGTSDEIEQTLGKMRRRDELHRLNAVELPEGGLDASDVAEGERKRKKKTKRKHVQSPTSTMGDKLDRLLDQLPKFSSTAKPGGRSACKSPWQVGNKNWSSKFLRHRLSDIIGKIFV